MKRSFSISQSTFDEMGCLVTAFLGRHASSEQGHRLEELIRQDAKACDLYLNLVFDSCTLRDWARHDDRLNGPVTQSGNPTFPASLWHGTVNYLSSGWPVAYLIATVILAVGALIGTFTYVSQPRQIAQESPMVANDHVADLPQKEYVGKITGMVDCKLCDSSKAPAWGRVAMGQKYCLASGLMEITYATGAKVILQGPATYEVESNNGGYLSIGKLVGKVEARHAKGFAIRVPNAVVTDLGTEFGVEVDSQGNAVCEVFRGEVQVVHTERSMTGEKPILLRTGQAVRVEAGNINIVPHGSSATSFVRKIARPQPTRILISTVDQEPAMWRYTINKPADGWMQSSFDDSSWLSGKASLACGGFPDRMPAHVAETSTPRPPLVSAWATPELWLRQEVNVGGNTHFDNAVLTTFHDSNMDVYVNGNLVLHNSGTDGRYVAFDITEKLLAVIRQGMNVVAVHVHGTPTGRQAFDLGLILNPKANRVSQLSIPDDQLQGPTITLVASVMENRTIWRWTTNEPDRSWKTLDFDDRSWREGQGGFGVPDHLVSASLIGTSWKTADLWLRKTVDVTNIPDDYLAALRIFHDDDVEVFVNGQIIYAGPGATTEWRTVDVTKEMKRSLQFGSNVIAVHVSQKWGGQYVDVGLKLYEKTGADRNRKNNERLGRKEGD